MPELDRYLEAIGEELRSLLAVREERVAPLYRMMQYHMGWLDAQFRPHEAPRGKRLRPVFCLLSCEAVGGEWRKAVKAACAIELIHSFSLIHDDIEDDSPTRRHRATVWKLWGAAQGINTGDAMWALSRLATSQLGDSGYDAATILRANQILDAACLELCTGQYLDLHFETADALSLADYERMILGKTAALLSAAVAVGAVLGGAEDSVIKAYAAFGRELGLTFQIVDDILGIWGDPEVTGKSAASDILVRKKTLPVLYALRWEKDHGQTGLGQLYAQAQVLPEDVPQALACLERARALEYSREQARQHQWQTLGHLDATGIAHPAQETLRELTMSLLSRSA